MDALVAAAKKEGRLNTIASASDWANFGTIMTTFQDKYGIKITNANRTAPARTSSMPSPS
jgi:putative spermidine/putrescine transport system substrate-binding protein